MLFKFIGFELYSRGQKAAVATAEHACCVLRFTASSELPQCYLDADETYLHTSYMVLVIKVHGIVDPFPLEGTNQ